MRPDILVRQKDGHAVLAVEAKARKNVDRRWAANLRRNMNAHGIRVVADYFMIITSDRAFLWIEENGPDVPDRLPDADAPVLDLLRPMEERSLGDGRTLELVVASWLAAATQSRAPGDLSKAAAQFLIDSGLLTAIHGASVDLQPA